MIDTCIFICGQVHHGAGAASCGKSSLDLSLPHRIWPRLRLLGTKSMMENPFNSLSKNFINAHTNHTYMRNDIHILGPATQGHAMKSIPYAIESIPYAYCKKNVKWMKLFNHHSAWKSNLSNLLTSVFCLFVKGASSLRFGQVYEQSYNHRIGNDRLPNLEYWLSWSHHLPKYQGDLTNSCQQICCYSWQQASSGWHWQIQVSHGQNCWRLRMPRWPWKLRWEVSAELETSFGIFSEDSDDCVGQLCHV